MLSILKESNDIDGVLRRKSVSVPTPISNEIREFCLEMKDFLKYLEAQYPEGQIPVGLAAPQVGVNDKIFVLNLPEEYKEIIQDDIFINPFYLYKSFSKQTIVGESCLSVDEFDEGLTLKRAKKIKICFLTVNGERKIATVSGFLAGIIQHEMDHLDGVLFYDKVKK